MVRQKIHWSPQPGKLACRRKISATSSYRGALSSREFVAKHEESPDMYCSGCAVVAAEWRGGVTFALDECEPPTIPSPRPSHRIRVRHLGNVRAEVHRGGFTFSAISYASRINASPIGILAGHLLGWRTICAVEIDAYWDRMIMMYQEAGFLDDSIWEVEPETQAAQNEVQL